MKEVKELIQKSLADILQQRKLQGFEAIKSIILTHEEWTPDNNLMTPSFKLKRKDLLDKYKVEIVDLYNEIDPSLNLPGGSGKKKEKDDKKKDGKKKEEPKKDDKKKDEKKKDDKKEDPKKRY